MSGKYFLSLAIFLCFVSDVFATSAQNCGLGKSEFGPHIFGGTPSPRGKWPWLVALIYRKHDQFFCGGSLISAKHVLSAAHCFQGKGKPDILSPHQVKALLGKYNLTDKSEHDSRSHLVREIVIQTDWKYNQESYDADIAILVLDEAAYFDIFARPICLPEQGNNRVIGTGVVAGWGLSENSEKHYEPTPLELEIPAVDGDTCYPNVQKLARYSSPRMFCGGFVNQSKAACTGDSGGGFYFPGERSIWTIRGIVSGGLITAAHKCDVDAYTLYTNVAKFRNWITEVMERRIDWVKVKFNCERRHVGPGVFTLECRLNEQTTSNSKFSISTVSELWNAEIDFTPSDHVLPGIGEEFPQLRWLQIVGKSVKFVERRDFANMSQLGVLKLIDLSIDFVPDDMLNDLPNLEDIEMENCKIDKIPEKLFVNQRALRTLYLRGNSITVLEEDLFKFNLELKAVYLDRNNLKQIFVDFTKTAITAIQLLDNDCISQTLVGDSRQIQNTVENCCKTTVSERPSDESCLCFPHQSSCQSKST